MSGSATSENWTAEAGTPEGKAGILGTKRANKGETAPLQALGQTLE